MQLFTEYKRLTPSEVFTRLQFVILEQAAILHLDTENFKVYKMPNSNTVHIIHRPGTDTLNIATKPIEDYFPTSIQSINQLNLEGDVHHHLVIAEGQNNRRHFVYGHIHKNHLTIHDPMPQIFGNYNLETAITLITSTFVNTKMTADINYVGVQLGNTKCGYYCVEFFKRVLHNQTIDLLHCLPFFRHNDQSMQQAQEPESVNIDWIELVDQTDEMDAFEILQPSNTELSSSSDWYLCDDNSESDDSTFTQSN